jgi:alpha-glucosidase
VKAFIHPFLSPKHLGSFAGSLALFCCAAGAIDLGGFAPIGAVAGYTSERDGIIVTCADHSQVRFQVLAADLIRVRASFGAALPERDHSWAIEKTVWDIPKWSVKESTGELLITTEALEVAVQRSPLLVEFRDAKTHRVINADQVPMMRNPSTGGVVAAKRMAFEEHFYGLGEKAARLDKRRGQFSMWNSDTPAYHEGTDPIYQDIPFYLGWQNGEAYGIFFDNSFRSHFDFGANLEGYAEFGAEGGEMNYYFFQGPAIKTILGRYADLTGHLPMPPEWALGNQQSRWSYFPDTIAEDVVKKYRAEDLPLDVLHLDIHYMNGYRVFTWDPKRFPDPSAFTDKLKKQGVKVVVIVDPGVKYQPSADVPVTATPELGPQDQSYYVLNKGLASNYFLKRKSGDLWIGEVWPGKAVYVDYTLDAAAQWWGGLFRGYLDHGVAGIWCDMNEPSDFIDQTGKTQMDVITYDGGANTPYAQNRNVFALNMLRATREGLLRLRPNERPYTLTRAGYAGIQRYSTMWTGDNTTTWDSLQLSIPMFATLGLSGEPFIGADIGGFIGRTDPELMTRWYEVGFLTPFCRNHAEITGYDHEPWRFGAYYEDIIRKYLKLRYRLLPFLYTALEDAHRTGVPMFRPLLLNYQSDYNTLSIDDEFMIGTDLLAAPILHPGQSSRRVYLPEGTWYDFWTGKQVKGGMIEVQAPLETTPLFVRAGAVIPMGPEMNYFGEKTGPLTLTIYADAKGRAHGSVYEDDGVSQGYTRGETRRTDVSYQTTANGAEIEASAAVGTYRPAARQIIVTVRDIHSAVTAIAIDGKTVPSIPAAQTGSGWWKSVTGVSVQFEDDGKAHKVSLR